MPDDADGRAALAHIDQALAERPERDGGALSSALRCVAAFRDAAIGRHRRVGDHGSRTALEHANAIVSVVMMANFPLGELPWAELEAARGWLAAALDAPAQ